MNQKLKLVLMVYIVLGNLLINSFFVLVLNDVWPQFWVIASSIPLVNWGLAGWIMIALLMAMKFIAKSTRRSAYYWARELNDEMKK